MTSNSAPNQHRENETGPGRVSELDRSASHSVAERFVNPIWVKCIRSRLRWKHVLSWGLVTLSLTAFVCSGAYLTAVERELTTPEMAARAIIAPILIIQGIILMLAGTGAVAAGVAGEREEGIIDFHRMTPMTPTEKILGYLLGLPVREYFLFLLTLPFLIWAVWKSDFPVLRLLHFYVVFFSSVLLYHMTGLVAGMWSTKPRWASMIAQGLVVVLYFVLPQLSYLGITFFEFLTVRPTFYVMLAQELERAGPVTEAAASARLEALSLHREVGFFNLVLHPTIFSLMVQGFLLLSMFVSVHRKWRDEALHPLPKGFSVAAFVAVLTLLVGSLWPFLTTGRFLETLLRRMPDMPQLAALALMIIVATFIATGIGVLLLLLITPTRWTALNGLRRARKQGRSQPSLISDAGTTTPISILLTLLTATSLALLMQRAMVGGLFDMQVPSLVPLLAPLVLVASVLLFIQGICERFSRRGVFVIVFVLWVIPVMATIILFAAFDQWGAGIWIASLSSPATLLMSLLYFFENAVPEGGHLGATFETMRSIDAVAQAQIDTTNVTTSPGPHFLPEEIANDVPEAVRVMSILHLLIAIGMQINLWSWRRTTQKASLAELSGTSRESRNTKTTPDAGPSTSRATGAAPASASTSTSTSNSASASTSESMSTASSS